MAEWKSYAESRDENAEIAASASETFFGGAVDSQKRTKDGSYNELEIINNSDIPVEFALDGLSDRKRKLFGKATVTIEAKDNIYFDTVKITNTSSTTAIDAADVTAIARILKKVGA